MNGNGHDDRLEEVAAYAIGALDRERVADLEEHLADCKRCQEELRWLRPAVQALPEAVERQVPPPRLKQRLMAEVRADADAAGSRPGVGERLRGLRLDRLTWKPLAGLAVAILVIAGGIGYLVGSSGGSGAHTTEVEPGPDGIAAKVVTEGDRGEIRLAGVEPLPNGRVLEAWVERDGVVEAVPGLFVPDQGGNATATIEDMSGVSAVMVTREPAGGTTQPTTKPIVEIPL
jgi:anti-sigma-K factor RskA